MRFKTTLCRAALAAAFAFAGIAPAQAQTAAPAVSLPAAAVQVQGAWIRAAVAGQSGTGAFMKLTAPDGARLVGVSTPVAGVAEVHEMKREGDTMKMRALANGLELPPAQTVELKPGGYHLMLMDLRQALPVGSSVPLTLNFESPKGVASALTLQVPVMAAPAADGGGHMQHRH